MAKKAVALGKDLKRRQSKIDLHITEGRNGMPTVVDVGRFNAARLDYLGTDPYTHAQLLQSQMAAAGVE